jgi:hypothetical protein
MGSSLLLIFGGGIVVALALWYFLVFRGAAKAKAADPEREVGRAERPGLRLGASPDTPERDVDAVDPHETRRPGPYPLHAVEPGATQAVCGARIEKILDESWPGSEEKSCRACEELLAKRSRRP